MRDDHSPGDLGVEGLPPRAELWRQLLERRQRLVDEIRQLRDGVLPGRTISQNPMRYPMPLLAAVMADRDALLDMSARLSSALEDLAAIDRLGADDEAGDRGPTMKQLRAALGQPSARHVPESHRRAAEMVSAWSKNRDDTLTVCRALVALYEVERPWSGVPVNLPAAWEAWRALREERDSSGRRAAAWVVRQVADPNVDHRAQWGDGVVPDRP
jgi:hypothetical protein